MNAPRRLHSIALTVEAADYLAGWRPVAGTLFLPALGESRVGEEVAARIGLFGQTTRATLFGAVSLVRRLGRPTLPPGVELTLEARSLPAARFLALAARGAGVDFRERAPRHAVDRPVVVRCAGAAFEATLRNVSEAGCAVAWRGPPPAEGAEVALRLREGLFATELRGIVCWRSPPGAARPAVGLRVLDEGRAARRWRHLVEEAARAGRIPT